MTTQISKQTNVNTEKKELSPYLKKSVYRNDSKKYYTKLDNETLRTVIEGDPITAKDIWLDALTCQPDWLFTTPNIATRHDIHPKKAQRLLTRLVTAGLAERQKVTDPNTGKIILHHYIFYESPVDKKTPLDRPPVDKKCPVGKNAKATENIEKNEKESTGQKVSSVSIKNKHIRKNNNNAPAGAAVDIKKIRAVIDPELNRKLTNKTIASLNDIPLERIAEASKEAMASNANSKPGLFITMAKDIPPDNSMRPVEIPDNADSLQARCIKCYNSNCEKEEPTCSTIKPNDNGIRNSPGYYCRMYCPFVLENMELFR